MLLAEIREQVIRYSLAKGIITDESSLNYDAIDADILVARNKIGERIISSRRRLSSQWYLTALIERNEDIQDSANETVYEVPAAICGIYSMLRGANGTDGGTIVKSVAEYYSPLTKQIPNRFRGYIENGILRINNSVVCNIKLTAAFVNPYIIKEWNVYYDNYPIEDGFVLDISEILSETFYKYVIGKPIDTKSDSAESTITPNQK